MANTGNPIIEKEIVMWVNNKLASAGKTTSTKSFQDSAIKDGKIVIDLIDSIKKGSINYDLVRTSGTEEVSGGLCFAVLLRFVLINTLSLSLCLS